MDFVWDGIKFKRGGTYEVPTTAKFLEFIKVGYLKEVIEEKESKEVVKTKELKGTKKTK